MKFKTPNTYAENYSKIPKSSGIYFFCTPFYEDGILFGYDKEQIIYIGSSKNLYNRYSSHSLKKQLRKSTKISFYFFETENYKQIEIELIKEIKPIFNIQYNKNY